MRTNPLLQNLLFKAAKLGEIKIMLELIKAGADPFAPDRKNHDAIFYASKQDSGATYSLLEQLKTDNIREIKNA